MRYSLSIVIIGRNEQASIGACIEAALSAAEEIGGANLLYVDSRSTDKTVEEVDRYNIEVKILDSDLRPSPSAARYVGSLHVPGDYILFLDADTLIYNGFLEIALKQLQDTPTLAGINGRIDDTTESGERVAGIDMVEGTPQYVEWLRGPCCLYRRSALLEVGSFDPALATEEEAELGLRLTRAGWKLRTIPIRMAHHTRCHHPTSLRSLISTLARDSRYGRLGEITRTIFHAQRAGNGLAFCWLRLKTTLIFGAWFLAVAGSFCLPSPGRWVSGALACLGCLVIYQKKRSVVQTLVFLFSKLVCAAELLFGLVKIVPMKR